jgi:hypothetical protein
MVASGVVPSVRFSPRVIRVDREELELLIEERRSGLARQSEGLAEDTAGTNVRNHPERPGSAMRLE